MQVQFFLTFCLLALCFSARFPKRAVEGLSPSAMAAVSVVPADLSANQSRWRNYQSGYSILMDWALIQEDSRYIGLLLDGAHPKLVKLVVKRLANMGDHQRLAVLLTFLGTGIDMKIWQDAIFKAACSAATHETKKHLITMDLLLQCHPTLSSEEISCLDDIFSAALTLHLSEFLLDYLMTKPMFPARRLGKMTRGWSDVIHRAIGQNKFVFLRKLIADWAAFKRTLNLASARFVIPERVFIPADSRSQYFIVMAIEAHFNVDMIWLLAGRTTLFETFSDMTFRAGHYGQRLFETIPELSLVDWAQGKSPTLLMAEFVNSVHERQPNNVAAQTMVLLSSTWKIPIIEYIRAAAETGSSAKILATIKAGKLKLCHLPLIHLSPCPDLVQLDSAIDEYFGMFDPHQLQYRNEGPVLIYLHILLGQVGWRSRERILSLISVCTTMGNMAVLRAVDQIKCTSITYDQLVESFPTNFGWIANQDPRSILNVDSAWTIMTFYIMNGNEDILKETIGLLPLITKLKCMLLCQSASALRNLLQDSINGDPRLFGFLHKEANVRMGSIIPKYVLSLLSVDVLHEIVLKATKASQINLLQLVPTHLGADFSEFVWIKALGTASSLAFHVLFDLPIATRLCWFNLYASTIEETILVPALLDDNYDLACKVLIKKALPVLTSSLQNALLLLASESRWNTLSMFFDTVDCTKPLYWFFKKNALLQALLEGGKKRLVGLLLRNKTVFELAIAMPPRPKWILINMFPLLMEVDDIEQAHKCFLAETL